MSEKVQKIPDSDEFARKSTEDMEEETDLAEAEEYGGTLEGMQVSNKSGKHSGVEKEAAARPEFGSSPGSKPVPGAFGNPENAVKQPPKGKPFKRQP